MSSEEIRRAFGEALRAMREKKGLSQQQLADASGVSRSHLIHIEQGSVNPTFEMGAQLVRGLQTTFAAFGAEIDRRLAEEEPEADYQLLADRILVVSVSGRMDASANRRFLMNLYSFAKRHSAGKVLVDLTGSQYSFTEGQEYDSVMEALKVFEELQYKPVAVAIIGNSTLSSFGTRVAHDHGLNASIFPTIDVALAWLRSEPG